VNNLTWQEEFDRRLRRVAGVRDDTVPVVVDGGETGHCHTCADYYVSVDAGTASVGFESFFDLLNAVLAVDWEDVHDA
jgi:hypothetical protein